ncbi:MAG: NUDIX domain-containing protein [Kiritimatiellae bacterium]|nr:NUDIX domain-containing protein [Kiritimatiellia bacterium]
MYGFFAAQRPKGKKLAFHWEFPGGQVEPNEDTQKALHREIEEELTWSVDQLQRLPDSVHEYDFRVICLIPFLCRCLERSKFILTEHMDSCWVALSV